MNSTSLLSGPRGRRMVLEYALLSERALNTDYETWVLHPAVAHAAYDLDPGRGTSRVMFVVGEGEPGFEPVTPVEVAEAMKTVPLAEVTPALLRDSLATAVDFARYWQEPDGEDVLVDTLVVRAELERVAGHIVASPHTNWWTTALVNGDQWVKQWQGNFASRAQPDAQEILGNWRAKVDETDARARRERPLNPRANWSGEWWSIPPPTLLHSGRSLFDSSPAGLWFTEDAGGDEHATYHRIRLPEGVRVVEIDSAETWAGLCRRFPLDVSGEKRHDWYRTTGRDGRWLMPDWSLVAQEYDGAHLTVAGYLSAAGTAIPVEADSASVIAGWGPDETWWFIDPEFTGETTAWRIESPYERHGWVRGT